jgi:phosphoribosylaminoimidazole-succinocarboxamide synthase
VTALLTTNLGATPLLGPGQGARSYAVDDALAAGGHRPHLGLRPCAGHGHSGQGQDSDADFAVLVRSAVGSCPNHLITADVSQFPAALQPYADQLEGRSMLVKRAAMFPVECVARGYLAGSGWKEYQASGTVCGIPLPGGLAGRIAAAGAAVTPLHQGRGGTHDENISFAATEAIVGAADAAELRG